MLSSFSPFLIGKSNISLWMCDSARVRVCEDTLPSDWQGSLLLPLSFYSLFYFTMGVDRPACHCDLWPCVYMPANADVIDLLGLLLLWVRNRHYEWSDESWCSRSGVWLQFQDSPVWELRTEHSALSLCLDECQDVYMLLRTAEFEIKAVLMFLHLHSNWTRHWIYL